MSFDPITGIWAMNKAAEIVGGSSGGGSGGSSALVLNLDELGLTMDILLSGTAIPLGSGLRSILLDAVTNETPVVVRWSISISQGIVADCFERMELYMKQSENGEPFSGTYHAPPVGFAEPFLVLINFRDNTIIGQKITT